MVGDAVLASTLPHSAQRREGERSSYIHRSISIGNHKPVALAVHVVDLHIGVILEVLAQLGDIDIHGTRIEIVVVYPDGLECQFALQHLVGMLAEEREELALLGGEFGLLITPHEELVLGVEGEGSELVSQRALGLLAT